MTAHGLSGDAATCFMVPRGEPIPRELPLPFAVSRMQGVKTKD